MKKKIAILVWMVLALAGQLLPQCVRAADVPEESELYAKSAVLMDAGSGRVLYEKNGSLPLANASTTKILTCIIILENCDLDQVAEISPRAAAAPKVHLGAAAGQKFYIKDLVYAMMLESYNDCAVALAEQMAGTVEDFAAVMNRYAEKIGCTDTYFITPNGLDAQDEQGFHHTTAEELARMMRYCITESKEADLFLKITGTSEHSFTDAEGKNSYHCYNHNAFLTMMDGALSGKTGFTGNAGYCYVGALERGGRGYIVALLACGWPNHKNWKWADTKKLMEYGLEAYQKVDLADYEPDWKALGRIPVLDAQTEWIGEEAYISVKLCQKKGISSVLLTEGEEIRTEYRIAEELTAPVEQGSCVGEVYLKLGDQILREYKVVAAEGTEKRTLGWCVGQVIGIAL